MAALPVSRAARALLFATILLAAGCGSRREFVSPYAIGDGGALSAPDAASLARVLDERSTSQQSLWVRADLVFRSDLRRGKDYVTATVLYKEPNQFRLLGSREVVGNLFDVLVIGDQASLFFTREGLRFDGSAAELRERLGGAGNLMPRDLLEAVLVLERLSTVLAGEPDTWAAVDSGEHWLVATRDGEGRQSFYRARKSDGLVDEWLLRDAAGAELIRVRYDEYRLQEVGGSREPYPWRFEVRVPSAGTTVQASLDRYRFDPPFVAKSFAPRQAGKVYPLAELSFTE